MAHYKLLGLTEMQTIEQIQDVQKQATCLCTQGQVEQAFDKMATEITQQLQHENPIILGVMTGVMVPLGHLLTRMTFPLVVDYVHATRYRGELEGGRIHWKAMPHMKLKDRTVLIVDDVLDGGVTLQAIVEYCQQQDAKAVYTAAVIVKNKIRAENALQSVDFSGLMVEDHYVFGYGLDYKEYLRNIPGIYAITD